MSNRNTQRGCCVVLSGVRDVSFPTTGDVNFGSVNAVLVMVWLKSAMLIFVFCAFPPCFVCVCVLGGAVSSVLCLVQVDS